MPDEHAVISPSGLPALRLCAGKLAAERGRPRTTSKAAEDGTRRHALMEYCANTGTPPHEVQQVGEYRFSRSDQDAASQIWPYLRDHKARKRAYGDRFDVEKRVEIGKGLGFDEGLFWGTMDLFAVHADTVEVLDHKFGQRLVSPDSIQLKAYAVGGVRTLVDPVHAAMLPEYAQVRFLKLTVAQPASPEVIRSIAFPVTILEDWMGELREIVGKALDPQALRTPGDVQCRYCLAAGDCRERQEFVGKSMFNMVKDPLSPALRTLVSTDPQPPEPIASVDSIVDIAEVKMAQDPESLDAEELGKILDQASLIEGWLKDVRKLAQERLASGVAVPGWKLVEGKRSRAWIDEDNLVEAFKRLGIPKRDFTVTKLVTPAQAEAIDKIAASPRSLERLKTLWDWKTGKPALRPESDPAPGIDEAHRMFEKVTEPEPEPNPQQDDMSWL